jgi:hypothetical protein
VSFSYDPTTDAGRVRLLVADTIEQSPKFTDAEIATFLTIGGGRVLLAAAQALESLAARRATDTRIVPEGQETGGTPVSAELRRLAQRYRDQDAADPTGAGFDIAEIDLDDFARRQIWINRALREQA